MPTITGTAGPDQIEPADKTVPYVVHGLAGDDNIFLGNMSDTVYGGDGNDYVDGGDGFDRLYGEAGDDQLFGGGANDVLYGGAGENHLFGEAGNDVIYSVSIFDHIMGGAGADTIWTPSGDVDGGDGNDIIHAGEGAYIYGGAGNDIIYALNGAWVFGDDGNDRIYHNGEGLTAEGGAGADTFYIGDSFTGSSAGGTGNDVYIVTHLTNHQLIEADNEGYDIVRSSISFYLEGSFEALQLEGTADIDGFGDVIANKIQGNSGANLLSGGDGVDTLNGGDGDDIIIGGRHNDLLRGGTGADVFRVTDVSAIGPTLETDTVYDFSTAEGDIVDISAIDSGDADGAFALVSAFSKTAGEMTLTFASGVTILRLDNDGDGRVDYQMKINGDVTGDSGGWLL